MLRITDVKLPLDHPEETLRAAVRKALRLSEGELIGYAIYKRSYDARRKGAITLIYTVDVEVRGEERVLRRCRDDRRVQPAPDMAYRFVARAPQELKTRPVVIGAGPAGIFAALVLAQMGFRPIILERGKSVRERTVDTFAFWRKKTLHPESNVQFGEGGAGTFSDGKLYSRVGDPEHYGRKVLSELVAAGAPPEIMYVSKPHIGTLRLVAVVQRLRAAIEALGGEFRFETRVDDIEIADGRVRALHLSDGSRLPAERVVLAVGHSARDTFRMLVNRGVFVEKKPISVGFRIEHPQSQIDRARFGDQAGHKVLGAADYKLVHHGSNGRSVYSFCMCPGGTVVAAASEPGGVVTNGMSQYSRAERNANAAIVVELRPDEDYPGDVLAGMELQRRLEQRAYELGGGTYQAPGQLVGDFLASRPSVAFGEVIPSFVPGVHLTDLSDLLPPDVTAAIREALPVFEKQIAGFARPDAVLTAVETRTSSPIRIRRGDDGQSINTRGLYPAGEGAGYAGGILSAGIDGIKAAQNVALGWGEE
jgi:hypothetical protein